MPFSAQNITKTFSVEIQRFIKNSRLSTFQIVVRAPFCRISTFFCRLSTFWKWVSETFFIGFLPHKLFQICFFHLAGVHPSFSVNDLMKLLRERKPEDSASFCILISGCSFSMFFAYSNRRPVIHSRNVILYVVLI